MSKNQGLEVVSIRTSSLSESWAQAYRFMADLPKSASRHLVVDVAVTPGSSPEEDTSFRRLVDQEMIKAKLADCNTVASTIFPFSLWNRSKPRELLYKRYEAIRSKVMAHTRNKYGVYFQRMVSYGDKEQSVNQLEHVIETWIGGNHRKSALQIGVFDPNRDHVHSRQRGFPCLQQVSLLPLGSNGRDGLAIVGLYPKQYWFERGYGNLLGLGRLGLFMSQEMGLHLVCVRIIALSLQLEKR